ncbi:hypothetical protein [Bartonella sp. DGB1]|uniref:hypothetical protein n=1 Tax=Bartonella sp. DGB1 TaxID=3239807 RepID=UPI0035267C59
MRELIIPNFEDNIETISVKIPYVGHYDWDYFLNFQEKRLIDEIENIKGNS